MIYVCVVSHGHASIIKSIACLNRLNKNNSLSVVVKDNIGESELEEYCKLEGIKYISDSPGLGFGANNNYVFELVTAVPNGDDYFVVLNPDVYVEAASLLLAVETLKINKAKVGAINLYRDFEYTSYDNSIRRFPGLFDFVLSYLGVGNFTIVNKDAVIENSFVDWAAGSLLIFESKTFKSVGGFNEKYHMYCEDLDICWRISILLGFRVFYMPKIKSVHLAQFKNRRLFSRHFFWHLKSAARYLAYRYGLLNIPN